MLIGARIPVLCDFQTAIHNPIQTNPDRSKIIRVSFFIIVVEIMIAAIKAMAINLVFSVMCLPINLI